MKKSFLLIIAIVSGAVSGYAQTHYEPGYFINNEGNKTNVLILNETGKTAQQLLHIKLTKQALPLITANGAFLQRLIIRRINSL